MNNKQLRMKVDAQKRMIKSLNKRNNKLMNKNLILKECMQNNMRIRSMLDHSIGTLKSDITSINKDCISLSGIVNDVIQWDSHSDELVELSGHLGVIQHYREMASQALEAVVDSQDDKCDYDIRIQFDG